MFYRLFIIKVFFLLNLEKVTQGCFGFRETKFYITVAYVILTFILANGRIFTWKQAKQN